MMFSMLLPHGHLPAMAAVALLIFGERLERPSQPSWRLRGLGRTGRIIVAQARAFSEIFRRSCDLTRSTGPKPDLSRPTRIGDERQRFSEEQIIAVLKESEASPPNLASSRK
jgi:hypothetical protein